MSYRTPHKAKHVTEVTPYKIAARFRVAPLSFSSLLFSASANRGHFHVTNELSPSPYTRGPSSASSRCVIRSCREGGATRSSWCRESVGEIVLKFRVPNWQNNNPFKASKTRIENMRFLSTKVQSKLVVGYFDVVHRVLDLPRHKLDNLYTKYERNFLATVRRIYLLQLNKPIIYFHHQYLMFRLRFIM